MSYYSRLAIATRGFRGGAGQTLFISQELTLEDADPIKASVISANVDVATIMASPLSVSIDQSSPISVAITDDGQAVTINTSRDSISVDTC